MVVPCNSIAFGESVGICKSFHRSTLHCSNTLKKISEYAFKSNHKIVLMKRMTNNLLNDINIYLYGVGSIVFGLFGFHIFFPHCTERLDYKLCKFIFKKRLFNIVVLNLFIYIFQNVRGSNHMYK